jgi:hypothetical protein
MIFSIFEVVEREDQCLALILVYEVKHASFEGNSIEYLGTG